MKVQDLINELQDDFKDAKNVEEQVIENISPYVNCAYSFDKLGYGKIVLIDFRSCSFPYVSSSIISYLKQMENMKSSSVGIKDICEEKLLVYIANILKSYFILLKEDYAHIESSVLHFDVPINTIICKEMIHISITPCLFDDSKKVILGLCMLTYSTRKQQGNVFVKLPKTDYHLELVRNKWEQINNSHLTNMEKLVMINSANGKNIKDIAKILSVSVVTVKTHRKNIFKKLGALLSNKSWLIGL